MPRYHVILATGEERDIIAAAVYIAAGESLVFSGPAGELTVAYASDAWTMVEVERKDDKE